LKTSACCTSAKPTGSLKEAVSLVHKEVENKYYGCGLVIPNVLEGMTILDLGCGAGRDCFILAKLVGEKGQVIGVDMTKEQLETARKYEDYHAQQFGYSKPNTRFLEGYIEKLNELNIEDNSIDIIV
jgi:ubiquinone/menaquinone biosynthesis C-methylase UbiE